ncbi:MAG: transglycosylase SLT domain-containing protein [Deltaproteobacteria bacterium]|nr:transglycosylase SLT domain-containing protein [Deltaproteobacteria bacterium]
MVSILGRTAGASASLPALISPASVQVARQDTRVMMSAAPLQKARAALDKGELTTALALIRPLRNGRFSTRGALLEAEARMAAGEVQLARKAFERALQTSDLRVTSLSAARGLVRALERLGDHTEALKYLDALIEVRELSDRAALEYRRAEILAALGRPKDAAEAASRLIIRRPESAAARRASALLDQLVARGVHRPRLSPALEFARAQRLAKLGDPDEALTAIRSGAERNPQMALAFAELEVDLLRRVDRDIQAEQILRRLRREGRSPRPDELLFKLGRIALSRDDNALAEAWFGELLSAYPDSTDAEEAAFFSAWLPFRDADFKQGAARMRAFAAARREAERRPEALWFAAFNAFLGQDFENAELGMRQLEAEHSTSPLIPKARYWRAQVEAAQHAVEAARRGLRVEMHRAPLTYYGFLARARLQAAGEDTAMPEPPDHSPVADPSRIAATLGRQRPILIDRALAYHEAGLDDYAREDIAAAGAFLKRVDRAKRDIVLDLLHIVGAHRDEFRYALRFLPRGGVLRPRSRATTRTSARARTRTRARTSATTGTEHKPGLEPSSDIASGSESESESGSASASASASAELLAWTITRHAYPLAHKDVVEKASADFGVAPELVLAIMRTESHFDPNARSHVGASGLMQLLPVTAERIGAEAPNLQGAAARFRSPDANIRLGTWYIRRLLDRYDGQMAPAIAAYNAGPIAVDGWLEDLGGLDLDVFVERIPYRETRAYVQRVLEAYSVYGLFDQRLDLSVLLAQIRRVPLPSNGVSF